MTTNEISRQAAVTLITVAGLISIISSVIGIGLLFYFCRWWRLRQIRIRQETYRSDKLQHQRLGDLRNPIRLGAAQDSVETYKYVIKDDEDDDDEEQRKDTRKKKSLNGEYYSAGELNSTTNSSHKLTSNKNRRSDSPQNNNSSSSDGAAQLDQDIKALKREQKKKIKKRKRKIKIKRELIIRWQRQKC